MDVVVVLFPLTNIEKFKPLSTTLPHFFTFLAKIVLKAAYSKHFNTAEMGSRCDKCSQIAQNGCFYWINIKSGGKGSKLRYWLESLNSRLDQNTDGQDAILANLTTSSKLILVS